MSMLLAQRMTRQGRPVNCHVPYLPDGSRCIELQYHEADNYSDTIGRAVFRVADLVAFRSDEEQDNIATLELHFTHGRFTFGFLFTEQTEDEWTAYFRFIEQLDRILMGQWEVTE